MEKHCSPLPTQAPLPVFCMARKSTIGLSSPLPAPSASILYGTEKDCSPLPTLSAFCMARRSTVVPFPPSSPTSNGRPGEGGESLSYDRA